MALKFALSQITGVVDGKLVHKMPGAVYDFADEDVAHLSRVGAVREPSDDEKALFKLANPGAAKAAEPAPAPKAAAPAPKAAAPAADDDIG